MPRDLEWIFFDLGHTLVDESEAHRVRLTRAVELLAGHGVHSSLPELWALTERAAAELAARPFFTALDRLGAAEHVVQAVRRDAVYDHAHERLYPGVAALLEQLAGSYRLGVIANQSLGTEHRLHEWGIHRHFAVIAASAELGVGKPDPRIFLHAAQRAGCAPERTMMVGDRLDNDIVPARRLGWRTVRVLQGFSSAQEPLGAADTPDATIASIGDLARALGQLPAS